MSSVTEQFNVVCKAHLDAMQQFAALAQEGAQNMLKLPAQAAREFASKDDGQPWFGANVSGVLSNWSKQYQDQTQKALDMTLAYWKNASLEQGELARLVQKEAAAASTSLLDGWQARANAADAAAKQSAEKGEHHRPKMVHRGT